jgi:predicted phosphohydrolase
VGDLGCNDNAGTVMAAAEALNLSVPDFDTTGPTALDIFLANGDLSYASSIDCFVDEVAQHDLASITKVTIGNHDAAEDGSDSIGQEALSTYGLPATGYYSFTIQNVHFLAMNTQISYSASSAQRTFVAADLAAAASNSNIKWIIVYYHKPSLTASSNHSALTDFRDIYHPLFDQYKVDLVIAGHNHGMQRSWPIKHNTSSPTSPTIMSTASNNIFTNIDGRIFIVAGAGGRSHHSISSPPSYIPFTNDNDYGLFFFHTIEAEKALVGFHLAAGSTLEVLDQFKIVKP